MLIFCLKNQCLALHLHFLNRAYVKGRGDKANNNDDEAEVAVLLDVVVYRDEKNEGKSKHSDVGSGSESVSVVCELVSASVATRQLVDNSHVRDLDRGPADTQKSG